MPSELQNKGHSLLLHIVINRKLQQRLRNQEKIKCSNKKKI